MTGLARAEAVTLLEEGHKALQALFARLSTQEMTHPATMGTGTWSAKDLLGHIAFWEELAAETVAAWRAGRRPPTEGALDGAWKGADAANARNQARTTAQSLEEVRHRADAAHRAVIEAIRGLSEEEWRAPPFYPGARAAMLGDLLGRVLEGPPGPFQHASAHLGDLGAYVASLSRQ